MKRRFLQFSLRGLLVALTVACLWLGWKVERAQKQQEAVAAIQAIGGVVIYDWHGDVNNWDSAGNIRLIPAGTTRAGPEWLRRFLGDHLFQTVKGVAFRTGVSARYTQQKTSLVTVETAPAMDDQHIEAIVPHLLDLHDLQTVYLERLTGGDRIGTASENRLRAALPHCQVVRERIVTAAYHPSP